MTKALITLALLATIGLQAQLTPATLAPASEKPVGGAFGTDKNELQWTFDSSKVLTLTAPRMWELMGSTANPRLTIEDGADQDVGNGIFAPIVTLYTYTKVRVAADGVAYLLEPYKGPDGKMRLRLLELKEPEEPAR